jgi:multidrug efflux pump subunit AcrA (membrane-fusion protein)
MKRVLTILLLAGAVIGAGLVLWQRLGGPAVTVVTAKAGRAVEAVYATAVVEPVHWGRVSAIGVGRIDSIATREGDKVKAGAAR